MNDEYRRMAFKRVSELETEHKLIRQLLFKLRKNENENQNAVFLLLTELKEILSELIEIRTSFDIFI